MGAILQYSAGMRKIITEYHIYRHSFNGVYMKEQKEF